MKDINSMRLGVLRELKTVIKFLQDMEKGVKARDNAKIYPAYVFITTLSYHMNEGDLSALSIELKQELLHVEYMREILS